MVDFGGEVQSGGFKGVFGRKGKVKVEYAAVVERSLGSSEGDVPFVEVGVGDGAGGDTRGRVLVELG